MNSKIFSFARSKTPLPELIPTLALGSFGCIAAAIFSISPMIPIAFSIAFFLALVFWHDPLKFLLYIIPIRMVLDAFSENTLTLWVDGLSFAPASAIGILISTLGIVFFVKFYKEVSLTVREFFPFWAVFLWGCFSLAFSISFFDTLRDVIRIFSIITLTSIAFVCVRTRNDLKLVLMAVIASSVIPMVVGFWQYATGVSYANEFTDIQRIYGTFGHPNVFGMYLFMIIVNVFFFLRFFSVGNRERITVFFMGFLAFVSMMLTLSRVSWVILFIFFLSLSLFKKRLLIIPVIFVSVFIFLFLSPVQNRVMELFSFSADSSVLWRISIWSDAISSVSAYDREILGFGLDTFPRIISGMRTHYPGSTDAHNDFVKFFVEGGIIGFLIYIYWMGWFVWTLWSVSKNKRLELRDRELSFLLFLLLGSLIFASLSDAVFKSTPLQWVFWVFLGAFMGLTKIKRYDKVQSHQ